jgi:hypothetical protein
MPAMQCNDFHDHLPVWMEGERAPVAEAHLRACGHCRELLSDLEEIRATGQALGEVEPPPRVWTAIRTRIEEEGLTRARGWRTWVPSFGMVWPRPAVAGATLAVLVAGAFLLGIEARNYNNSQRWTQGTEAATRPIDANLGNFELHEVSALHGPNQAVNASFQKNLQIVDKYIAMCEKSVREEPENELARDYLYGAYQQKADLLAEMSERGENPQ